MEKVIKTIISFFNGMVAFCLWLMTMIMGSAVLTALFRTAGAMRRYSKSRGSIFDTMHLQGTLSNPLQGEHLSSGMMTIFVIIALVIALSIIIKGIRSKYLKTSVVVNLQSLSISVAAFCLVDAAGRWLLLNKRSGAATEIIIAAGISIGLNLVASLLKK